MGGIVCVAWLDFSCTGRACALLWGMRGASLGRRMAGRLLRSPRLQNALCHAVECMHGVHPSCRDGVEHPGHQINWGCWMILPSCSAKQHAVKFLLHPGCRDDMEHPGHRIDWGRWMMLSHKTHQNMHFTPGALLQGRC